MKSFLIALASAGITTMLPLTAQQPAPAQPKPAPPVSAPKPGMKWVVAIGSAGGADGKTTTLRGMQGPRIRSETVTHPDGKSQTWFHIGGRIFTMRDGESRLIEISPRDKEPDAAHSFHVGGFTGISWISPATVPTVVPDKESGRWLAVCRQEPAPFKVLGEGENAVAVPTGPTVAVEATFDAKTGLPLYAKVGNKLYTYQVSLTGGTDPELPPALREGIMKKLKRQAALAEAIRKQEGGQR